MTTTQFFRDENRQKEFHRNGYVILDLLDPSGVASLRDKYHRLMQSRPTGQGRAHLQESSRMHDLEWNLEVSHTLRDAFAESMGRVFQNHELFGGTFLLKESNSTRLGLHQDWSVVDEERYQSLFVWCPLVDTRPENGGIFVLPGSHAYFQNIRSGSMQSLRITPEGKIRARTVDVNLPAGRAIAYSDRLFHGSYPNTTAEQRIVCTARVNQAEAELLYYHRVAPDRVDIIRASDVFYLKNGAGLDRGELPEGSEVMRTMSYRYVPVTESDLAAKLG